MATVCNQDKNFFASVSFSFEAIDVSDEWPFWEETESNTQTLGRTNMRV